MLSILIHLPYFQKRLHLSDIRLNHLKSNDPELISEIQLLQLQQVWDDAITNIPYYRNIVVKRLAPPKFKSIAEFTEYVPILSKKIVQNSPELFMRQISPDYWAKTAGSTGEPLQFGLWKSEGLISASNVDAMRCYHNMDWSTDRIFLIWGHAHLLGTGLKGKLRNWERKFKDWNMGYYRADAYHLDRNSAIEYFNAMSKFRPNIVCGYSNAIDLVVRHNLSRAKEAQRLGIKFVICTAEMLPKEDSREVIEDFFNAPLMMEYGGVDLGAVGHSWKGKPYQVNWWDYIGEFVGDAKLDKAGPLLVTTLYPRYFPLIRYDTGDEIRQPVLGADRQVIQFANLVGRQNDVLVLEDGHAIHSVGLFHCIHQESSVHNIQLIVNQDGLEIILVGTEDESVTRRIRMRLYDLHPKLANATIKYMDDLITTIAGKRRWIIDMR